MNSRTGERGKKKGRGYRKRHSFRAGAEVGGNFCLPVSKLEEDFLTLSFEGRKGKERGKGKQEKGQQFRPNNRGGDQRLLRVFVALFLIQSR